MLLEDLIKSGNAILDGKKLSYKNNTNLYKTI